jgi:Ca2+/H+ antiporter
MIFLAAVVEVESALRHKARLERHQRTTERVVYLSFFLFLILLFFYGLFLSSMLLMHNIYFQTKALAEKSMRDLLAQREQAEKHVRHLHKKRTFLLRVHLFIGSGVHVHISEVV